MTSPYARFDRDPLDMPRTERVHFDQLSYGIRKHVSGHALANMTMEQHVDCMNRVSMTLTTQFIAEALKPNVPELCLSVTLVVYATLWDALKDKLPKWFKKFFGVKIRTRKTMKKQNLKVKVSAAYPKFPMVMPDVGPHFAHVSIDKFAEQVWDEPQSGTADIDFEFDTPKDIYYQASS